MIGDCGVTRLNKDGIGAAYRTAKAAARTAIFEGVSAEDFRKHYWPVCQAISGDNRFTFASDDMLGGTAEEKSAAFDSYVSYCGTFQVGEESVVHRIDTCLFPNWVGTSQERLYKFEGNLLFLSTKSFLIKGEQQTAHLIWRRT